MAGGDKSRDEKRDDDKMQADMERWERSRRDDLADAIGLIVVPPFHGADETGEVKFGLRPLGGFWDDETLKRYMDEVQGTVQSSIAEASVVDEELQSRRSEVTAEPYSVGPAAQEWPKYLLLLYEYGRPVLENAVLIYSAGQIVQSIVKKIRRHDLQLSKDKNRSLDRFEARKLPATSTSAVEAELMLTSGALVSLCMMDLHDRYEPIGVVDVEIHTRSRSSYSTQGHPGFVNDVHLVRVQLSGRSLFWSLQTDGRVLDHYQILGARLTQLPLPSWFKDEVQGDLPFESEVKDYRIRWKGIFD